ncbi:DUF3854 domain-containing protein [Desertifilum sp. FACHB-1129]|uniref:DUF3854 domain-containing protein n=1 Tax=Desertifilum tharense IPPAS B-1220 TaxID=1781255 RepID=A0A1E5QDE9_9CYAN|nr:MULTISPECIES: plasmid replication protein, CyRepA1 family [unclassified Desertifilum]MBD2315140.1 DUF3854 domain-containing protein [Desertifilum sp. FACHB-1129]MBD2323748.1 DUF3854 domain-containing protein [Desertifilum sp. FACHB-866]MBD2333593.1 DUF3854 domain-containing protein [Desertifilum sp. FACHB-868]OEJ72700.1 hypothetical protein BH720_23610 [Desertifilum tharense IPPAS B-1220]
MHHLQEWGRSCVDTQLTRLNVTFLDGQDPYNYLLYSDNLPRRNDGRVSNGFLQRYQHIEQGGWWCSGVDLLTGSDDLWGCFKPAQPRRSQDGRKLIKYEHPPKAPIGVFALRVPLHIWQKISQRYQVPISPNDRDETQPDGGFWQWVQANPKIPLCITEGAKKAGTLLTAGYAAVALPGIFGAYRVPRNEQGNRIGKPHLIPQLEKLAIPKREVTLIFDQDTKPKTVKAVHHAIRQTGYLLTQAGCSVKVVTWNPELGKGVDDLIANHSPETFEEIYQQAVSLELWKAQSLSRLTYSADLQVNDRYLGELSIPASAKLVGIKSAKGTGKSKFLETVVKSAIARQQWVLVIGHRVRLVEELCQRFGLDYITEVRHPEGNVMGYGLCLDSLHSHSQARFNAADWTDGVVIIDEVEQVLWHGLNSRTCNANRVAILKSLKTLMQNVLGGEGQVFVADADLSDTSLEYLLALAGVEIQPYIIENDWKPGTQEAWEIFHYPDTTPERLVGDLTQHIKEGGKPFVCLSAQRRGSQWGTCSLEAYLNQEFPQHRILRIDSESLADPTHPAYGGVNHLDTVLANYDIVLASPAIETGVSIELQNHFTSVWGIAQGVQAENSVRQALSRIRAPLPRFLWVAPYGFNQVGNGSTSIPGLLTSAKRLTQLNIRALQQTDFEAFDDLEVGFQAESLFCWAKMAVRLNATMLRYREAVLEGLRVEGHSIIEIPPETEKRKSPTPKPVDEAESPNLTEAIATAISQNYQAECEAIATSPDLTDSEYQLLKKRIVKTTQQRRSQRKYELQQRYGILVTPELVQKDEAGWYEQLRLHYFLTCGQQYLASRDRALAQQLIEQGEGNIFLPDFNRSQLGATIGTMARLGMGILLANETRELKNTDEDLQAMSAIALANRPTIKTTVGIGIAANSTPVTIVRRFLDKIGYGLKLLRCESLGKKRIRVYQIDKANDGREAIFQQWLARDSQMYQPSSDWQEPLLADPIIPASVDPPKDYIQLQLAL